MCIQVIDSNPASRVRISLTAASLHFDGHHGPSQSRWKIREYRQSIEQDGAGRADPARSAHFPAEWRCEWVVSGKREKCSDPWRSPSPFTLGGSQGGARPPSPTVALDEAALRAAVEWSIRYLPDFRLPDKALDLVDQACAAARFRTLTPQGGGKKRGETSNPVQLAHVLELEVPGRMPGPHVARAFCPPPSSCPVPAPPN